MMNIFSNNLKILYQLASTGVNAIKTVFHVCFGAAIASVK